MEAISNYILSSERDKAKINELESEITNLLQKGQLIYYYRWVEKNIRNVNVNDEDRDIFKMLENILIDEDDLEKAIEILEDWYKIFISLKGTFKPPETFLDTIKNKLKSAIQGTKERLTDIWTKEQLTDPLTDYWTKQLKNIEARHLAEADLIQPGMPDTRNVPAELLKTYPEHFNISGNRPGLPDNGNLPGASSLYPDISNILLPTEAVHHASAPPPPSFSTNKSA